MRTIIKTTLYRVSYSNCIRSCCN